VSQPSDCSRLASIFASCQSQHPTQPADLPRVTQSRHTTSVSFPSYRAVVSHGSPLGIVDLRLSDYAQIGLSHGRLPLADWEWLMWTGRGNRRRAKLLDARWRARSAETKDGITLLR
jgi:hypothetical protein